MPKERVLVAIPCRLSLGAFSGERIFTVKLANGEMYTSLAPRQFCWTGDGKLVSDKEPSREADGLVAARIVDQIDNDQISVEIPDGEVIAVEANTVRQRPTRIIPPKGLQVAG